MGIAHVGIIGDPQFIGTLGKIVKQTLLDMLHYHNEAKDLPDNVYIT